LEVIAVGAVTLVGRVVTGPRNGLGAGEIGVVDVDDVGTGPEAGGAEDAGGGGV
jgi:hypothetical protein